MNTINLGITLKNPLNIRYSAANHWLGMLPNHPKHKGFCSFATFDHGYRAAILLMKNYICRYGCNTPKKIIYRWAPPCENQTDLYLACVCGRSGLKENEILSPEGMPLCRLTAAMTRQETGLRVTPEYLSELRQRFHI